MADHDKLCLTRPKARKIFNAEKEKLANNNNIVIDLTGLDVIAKSFLDEFIKLLAREDRLSSAIFEYDSRAGRENLEFVMKLCKIPSLRIRQVDRPEEVLH